MEKWDLDFEVLTRLAAISVTRAVGFSKVKNNIFQRI